jgi:hypothetical protein
MVEAVRANHPDLFTGSRSLDHVIGAFDDLMLMPDHGPVIVTLAGTVANYAEGDAVFVLEVGPPGCGKSELVNSVTLAPGVWSLSSLTPQTLLSGFERKGEPASMLLQIGRFGILAMKDLTTVLTMSHEAKAAIIGQLREVADGKTEKSFGNGLRVEWEGKLGLVGGVTPIIDEQHMFLAVMGERFVLFRMPRVDRRALARKALESRGHERELRDRIRVAVAEFLEPFRWCGALELGPHFNEPLIELADMVTRARSGVARDGYSRELLYIPDPEAPTRLMKQLAQLGAAMIAIGAGEVETWRLVRKIGWDSVPAVRVMVLDQLAEYDEMTATAALLQEATALPQSTVNRVVEDLVVLGLVRREKVAGKWQIALTQPTHDYWNTSEKFQTAPVTGQIQPHDKERKTR